MLAGKSDVLGFTCAARSAVSGSTPRYEAFARITIRPPMRPPVLQLLHHCDIEAIGDRQPSANGQDQPSQQRCQLTHFQVVVDTVQDERPACQSDDEFSDQQQLDRDAREACNAILVIAEENASEPPDLRQCDRPEGDEPKACPGGDTPQPIECRLAPPVVPPPSIQRRA